jgi:hypothetical protein
MERGRGQEIEAPSRNLLKDKRHLAECTELNRNPSTDPTQKPPQEKSKNTNPTDVAGSPDGLGPKSKSSEAQHDEKSQKPMTTFVENPITHGSRMNDWAPSLLAGPFGQESFKLSHLLVEHTV